jgi:predicted nucleic-acid-binding protein
VIAADTNVVVRLLTNDEPRQSGAARRLFAEETVFLPRTVLLESEWVLRRLYRFDRGAINTAIDALIRLPDVRVEDEPVVTQALVWHRVGMDFADALHLAASHAARRFATFDQALIKAAIEAGRPASEP